MEFSDLISSSRQRDDADSTVLKLLKALDIDGTVLEFIVALQVKDKKGAKTCSIGFLPLDVNPW